MAAVTATMLRSRSARRTRASAKTAVEEGALEGALAWAPVTTSNLFVA
jgi:hypothetical protein